MQQDPFQYHLSPLIVDILDTLLRRSTNKGSATAKTFLTVMCQPSELFSPLLISIRQFLYFQRSPASGELIEICQEDNLVHPRMRAREASCFAAGSLPSSVSDCLI